MTCGKEGSFREWSGDTFQPKGSAYHLGKTWCTCIT